MILNEIIARVQESKHLNSNFYSLIFGSYQLSIVIFVANL